MPPCSENRLVLEDTVMTTPRKNVVFAVNYEVSMVDQFMAHKRKRRRSSVEGVPESTEGGASVTKRRRANNVENTIPENDATNPSRSLNVTNICNTPNNRTPQEEKLSSVVETPKNTRQTPAVTKDVGVRKSARERTKKGTALARARVRYDMQAVPPAKRNRAFLKQFLDQQPPKPRRSSRLSVEESNAIPCLACEGTVSHSPFEEDETVLWIPSKRSEWEDTVPEMTAVCTSAAIRRHMMSHLQGTSNTTKPFHAPLSRDYIRDRVDIDDPLNGYQLRHREGGWLQGFILWTNFTSWNHFFKWDSLDPKSGFQNTPPGAAADFSGELANELEAQPRSGDPHGEGVVFHGVAEIALLGGLGCGEYLLRMALESIRTAGSYKFVVLQATDASKTFYERFGFVRVGAICRYEKQPGEKSGAGIVGYRHWTHANESETSLQKHGGPSYMMCLKLLPLEDSQCSCGRTPSARPSFLDCMMELKVDEKPTIEPLGSTSTPLPKSASRRNSTPNVAPETSPSKRGRRASMPTTYSSSSRTPATTTPRRKSSAGTTSTPEPLQAASTTSKKETLRHPAHKHSLQPVEDEQPLSKRRRLDGTERRNSEAAQLRASLMTPPKNSKPLSYAQKQYHSVWLAVPPSSDQQKGRPPPKRRASSESLRTSSRRSNKSPTPCNPAKKVPKADPLPSPRLNRRDLPPPPPLVLGSKPVATVNKTALFKQKVRAYPRTRVHFYNRVVRKKGRNTKQYYFVLQYDEPTSLIKIVPMQAKGKLSGKREGRPRYQAEVGETDANFLIVKADDYEVVPAAMVMKTPLVAQEAWDVEDD